MTKVWCRSAVEEEFTEAQIATDEWFDSDISVFDCTPVSGDFPKVVLELRWSHPPADFFQPGTMFIVSDRLKTALEEFPIRAEFFSVRVVRNGVDVQGGGFYYCNILDCVDCLDYENGEYVFESKSGFTNLVREINRLVIDGEKANGHDLFRIANGGEGIVCTSDRVASRISDGQFTGVRMIRPEDWRFGIAVK